MLCQRVTVMSAVQYNTNIIIQMNNLWRINVETFFFFKMNYTIYSL